VSRGEGGKKQEREQGGQSGAHGKAPGPFLAMVPQALADCAPPEAS
jgi:hypothetical protein